MRSVTRQYMKRMLRSLRQERRQAPKSISSRLVEKQARIDLLIVPVEPLRPTQTEPLTTYLPEPIQTYDTMGRRVPKKAHRAAGIGRCRERKLYLISDLVSQKSPIVKSHHGKERKCAMCVSVFQPYCRPHCESWTVLSITISRVPRSVLALWLISPPWFSITAIYQIHFPTQKDIFRHFTSQGIFSLNSIP